MRLHKLAPTLIMLLLNAIISLAQVWESYQSLSRVQTTLPLVGSSGRTVILDTCGQRIWVSAGNRLFVTTRGVDSLLPVQMPLSDGRYTRVELHLLGCRLATSWVNGLGEQEFSMWEEATQTWKRITPVKSINALISTDGHSTCMYVDIQGSRSYIYRTDEDRWVDFDSLVGKPSAGITRIVANDSGYIFKTSTSWLAYNVFRNSLSTVMVVPSTHMISMAPGGGMIAAIRGTPMRAGGSPCLVAKSPAENDWTTIDTIVCTNNGLYIVAKDSGSPMTVGTMLSSQTTLCIIFTNGVTVVTRDSLRTFQHAGTLPCRVDPGSDRFAILGRDGEITGAPCGQIVTLSAAVAGGLVTPRSPMLGVSTFAQDGSGFVATTEVAVVSSRDGVSWRVITPPDSSMDSEDRSENGFHRTHADRIYADRVESIVAGRIEGGAVFRLSTDGTTVPLCVESAFSRRSTNASRTASAQHPFVQFRQGYVYGASAGVFVRTSLRDGTSEKLISAQDGNMLRFAWVLNDSVHFVQTDSLRVSMNGGRTWTSVSGNLPTNASGQVATVACMYSSNPDTITIGLRGMFSGGLSSPGGVYRTEDGGSSWRQISPPEFHNRTVVSIYGSDRGLLAWTRRIDATDEFGTTFVQDSAELHVYERATSLWRRVFEENRYRPAFPGSMAIVRLNNGVLVSATSESGVIHSSDDGNSWRMLGDLPFSQSEIYDLAVDPVGTLYASTKNGILSCTFFTTSVDETTQDLKGNRFLNVWTYPAPASGSTTICLSNPDILRSGIRSIRLFDEMGRVVSDLTPQYNGATLSDRFEATINVADIPNGLYIVTVDTGSSLQVSKMLVAH